MSNFFCNICNVYCIEGTCINCSKPICVKHSSPFHLCPECMPRPPNKDVKSYLTVKPAETNRLASNSAVSADLTPGLEVGSISPTPRPMPPGEDTRSDVVLSSRSMSTSVSQPSNNSQSTVSAGEQTLEKSNNEKVQMPIQQPMTSPKPPNSGPVLTNNGDPEEVAHKNALKSPLPFQTASVSYMQTSSLVTSRNPNSPSDSQRPLELQALAEGRQTTDRTCESGSVPITSPTPPSSGLVLPNDVNIDVNDVEIADEFALPPIAPVVQVSLSSSVGSSANMCSTDSNFNFPVSGSAALSRAANECGMSGSLFASSSLCTSAVGAEHSGAGAVSRDAAENSAANGPEQRTLTSAAHSAAKEDVRDDDEDEVVDMAPTRPKKARLEAAGETKRRDAELSVDRSRGRPFDTVQPRQELAIPENAEITRVFVLVDTNVFHNCFAFVNALFEQAISEQMQGLPRAGAERCVALISCE